MLAGHSRAPRVASRRRRPSRRPVASGPARGDARQRPSPWRCRGSLIRPGPGPGPRGCDQRLGAAAPVCRRASDVTERAGGMSESESAPGSPPSSRHKPKIASRKRGAPAQASRRCIRKASESAGSRAEFIRDRDRDTGPGPDRDRDTGPGPAGLGQRLSLMSPTGRPETAAFESTSDSDVRPGPAAPRAAGRP